jgi:hypothetical protein
MREKIPTLYLKTLALKTRTTNGLNYVFEAYDLQIVALRDVPGNPRAERVIVGDWAGNARGSFIFESR